MNKLLFLLLLPVVGYSQNILWTNEFDNASDWILDNSCSYATYNISGGYDYVNQTTINAPSACTSPGTLAIDPNTGNTAQWRFETDPNIIPVGVQSPFVSPTASNGFLFIDSDAFGGADGDGTPTFVTATTANSIDLSGENNVVLSFSHNYRWWQDTRGVRVSGDNGTTWYQYELTNNSGYPNDQNSGNPEITDIDISSLAGGQSQVLIQFYYEDNDFWAWYWAVDDVIIKRRELNNIVNVSSWIYGENNYGAEYGRTPIIQLDANWYIGAEALNNGVNDQINVSLNANYSSPTIINTNSSIAIVESDSTTIIESLEPLTLSVGVYQGSLSVSSNADQAGGANSIDNTLLKNFEVTSDLYSLDGVGLHPAGQEILSGIGTASFTGAEDGLVCATGYPIKQQTNLSSVEILIDGQNSTAGAQVILYIIDSLNFISGLFNNSISTSNLYTLTSQDIANGYIDIQVCTTLNPGYFYAAVELFSGGGTYNIRVVDDITVTQPDWSSAIWFPLDQAYTNGNAFAIRLNTTSSISTSTGIDIQTACDSYTWIDGNTYTSSNNSATFTLPNGLGCDSTVTLDLTLNNSVSNNITSLYCQSYSHNGISYNSDSTFTNYFTSSLGCDSIVYTSYTVDNSYGTDSIVACNSYTWIDGNTYTSSNSSATYIIQNSSGCDSIINLVLTINSSQFNTDFTVNQSLFTAPPFAAQFSNTTPNLSDYDFTWDFSDGTILQSNNPSVFHQFLNNGLYDVTLIAEDIITGCTDTMYKDDFIFCTGGTSCTHSSTINQTGPITACLSDSIFLTCNTDPTFSYQWRLNGTYIPGAVDTIYYPSQSGNYSVLISQNGCPEISGDISVTISPNPNPPFITSNGSFVSCQASSVTLSVPNNFATYAWSSGGTSFSEVVSSSGSYFVTVTNSGGCASTSLPFNLNASFLQPPDVCIVGLNPQTNFNRVVWEKPVSTAIDSFYVYKETNQANIYQKLGGTSFADSAIFDDVSSDPATQAYRYKLSVVDSCGIESNLGVPHKTIHLTINQGIGTSWNLIWSGYEGISFLSYNIYRGTSSSNMALLTTIASNLNSYTDLTAPGGQLYYQIELVSSYSCDPSKSYNTSRSNVVENGEAPSLIINQEINLVNVFPNPTNENITISVSNYNGNIQTEVYDLIGNRLQTTSETTISLRDYARGIYILKVAYGDRVQELKVIKE